MIWIQIKAPNEVQLYNAILKAIGAVFNEDDRHIEKKKYQLLGLLEKIGTRQLLIDEVSTAIAGPEHKKKTFLNALKYIGNEARISIAAAGTAEALTAIGTNEQLENRFEPVGLPLWEFGDDFRALLEAFEQRMPLRFPSVLQEPSLAMKLYSMSEGYLGELAELLMRAGVLAVKSGKEKIDSTLLDRVNWDGPTKRRNRRLG